MNGPTAGYNPRVSDLGKLLLVIGAFIAAAGLLLIVSGRLHFPLGHLPGDIVVRRRNTVFYFPIATSILLSILVSVVFYLVGRFTR